MKNRAKKFLSLILAMAMLVSTFSVAFAAEEEASAELFADEAATVATGTTVTTASALSSAIANGGTIILGADIEVTSTLRIQSPTTLDLNGYAITGKVSTFLFFAVNDLTIIDSSSAQTGKISNTGNYIFRVNKLLNIYGGEIVATRNCLYVASGGTVSINGGTFLKGADADTTVQSYIADGYEMDASGNVVENPIDTYEELKKAIAKGGTVKLGGDITLSSNLTTTLTTTIDLNGYTITCTNSSVLMIKSNTTIIDSSAAQTGTIEHTNTSSTGAAVKLESAAVLNINGGTINSSSGYCVLINNEIATVNIADGSFENTATSGSKYVIGLQKGRLDVTDGTFDVNSTGASSIAISGGEATISGGEFNGGRYSVSINSGELDISGGTLTSTIPLYIGGGTTTISGGEFNGASKSIQLKSGTTAPTITGGTFLKNGAKDTTIANYLTSEYTLDANGNVVDASTIVVPPVAKIGETGYASLAAAVEAAQSGDTITLVESPCRIDETISITKNITIDFNGCGITGSSVSPFAISGATLTLVNSGATSSATMSVGRAITLTNGAVLNLESGTLQGTINAVTTISATDSTVNISGGRVVNTSSSSSCTINAINSKVNITGGMVNSKVQALSADADSEVSITGGRFLANNLADETIETYLSSGYELDASGNVVVATPVVAKIGDVGYASLAAAVEAAVDGDTITLLRDVELSYTLIVDKARSVTIDGNGKKIGLADSFTNTNAWGAAIMLGNSGYGDPFTAYHAVTIKNVVFEGITGNAIIRAQGITLTVDGCTVANCDSTNTDQGMFRIDSTVATIKNSTFDNNKATKILGHNHNTSGSDSGMVVDNVSFTDNTITGPGVIVLSSDAGATIKDSEFTGNNVACTNGAVVYMGFTENNAVTGNLFKDNVVSGNNSNNRIAGALFLGWEAEVSGNAFVNNTATNASGIAANDVCIDTIYATPSYGYDICFDLSENYFDGVEPAEGDAYIVNSKVDDAYTLTSYYKSYTLDTDGNVALSELEVLVSELPVAKIGDVEYTSLQDAVEAAQSGDTITLLADIELTEGITIAEDDVITLDLAGKTVSQEKEQTTGYQMILNDGSLTINDTVGGGKISYTDTGVGGEYISDTIYNRGTLVIKGGTIENNSSATVADNGYPHAVDTYSGIRDISVTIDGGTITCAEYSAIRMFCVSATNKADLVINGGTINGAVDMQNGTKVAAIGSLTINGGDFNKNKSSATVRFANWNGGAEEYGITEAVKGGKFDAIFTTKYVPAVANWDKKIVAGGTFEVDPSEYCEDGYEAVQNTDGTYGVQESAEAVAQIGEVKYTSLAEAVAEAQSGDTIVLLADVELAETLTIPVEKTITLDLAGYKVSQEKECTAHYSMIENKGDLTITDSSDAKTGTISFTDTGAGDAGFGWGSYTITNRGTLTVESGTIANNSEQNQGTVVHMYCAIQQAGGTVTINGGTIKNETYRSIRVNKGDLVITDGTFKGQIWLQPNQGDATIAVSGGTFAPSGVDGSSIFLTNAGEGYTVTSASFTGGTFTTKIGASDPTKKGVAGAISGNALFTESAKANTNEALVADGYVFAGTANADGLYGIEEADEKFELMGANMVLGNELAMNFFIRESDLEGTEYYAVINFHADGEVRTETIQFADWEYRSANKAYVVRLEGIYAVQMSDKIDVTIFNADGTQASEVWNDSVKDYATRVIKNTSDEYSRTLAVDMLNYGAAAQDYFGYNTENLANADIDEYQQYASPDKAITDNRVKGDNYYGSSLVLLEKIDLKVYFSGITDEMTSNMSAKVTYTDLYGKTKEINVSGDEFARYNSTVKGVRIDTLTVGDGAQMVTVTVYNKDGSVYGTVQESMVSYAARAINNHALFGKVAKFVESSNAYLLK